MFTMNVAPQKARQQWNSWDSV